jgi:hypothetical protein
MHDNTVPHWPKPLLLQLQIWTKTLPQKIVELIGSKMSHSEL